MYLSLVCLILCPLTLAEDADKNPSETTKKTVHYDPVIQNIEGWTIHVDPTLLEGEYAETGARIITMLANHLQRIAILVDEDHLKDLQSLEIWLERHHPDLVPMQYHPSPGWIESHNYDPRLAKKVHIPRAEELLSRHLLIKHPMVVLHELAHAYHDQILSFDEERIIEAYTKAKESGTYDKILLFTGDYVEHYGMNDHKEFFAEATEAYFYRNDFYPFVRAELKEHDPTTHDLLAEIWGPIER
jgi:dipeptidyl-peptidase-4